MGWLGIPGELWQGPTPQGMLVGLTRGIVGELDPQLHKQNFAHRIFAKQKLANIQTPMPLNAFSPLILC